MRDSYHVIEICLNKEDCERGLSLLDDENCIGMEEEGIDPVRLKAFFASDHPLTPLVERLRKKLGSAVVNDGKTFVLDPSVFKAGRYEPFKLVENVWVIPPPDLWMDKKIPLNPPFAALTLAKGEKIVIRPGMGFGTGRDDTTRLAAQNYCTLHYKIPLTPFSKGGIIQRGVKSVLDVGTGSGILAITAFKLGAKKVDAVEIDPDALDNARENLALNGIDSIRLYSDICEVPGTYDVVIANIITPTILQLADTLKKRLIPDGHFIFSGILQDEEECVMEIFHDYQIVNKLISKEWMSLLLRKSQ